MMTKFLIDEDVNQKVLRKIPIEQKGFDIVYPESGYKGALDQTVKQKAASEGRVLVTCDKDFSKYHFKPEQFPGGVLLLRQDPRHSQKRLGDLLKSFCEFILKAFPDDPYNFAWKIVEIHVDRIEIQTRGDIIIYPYH
jgi:predicted nuclease of predicted toxin-antitoxin system